MKRPNQFGDTANMERVPELVKVSLEVHFSGGLVRCFDTHFYSIAAPYSLRHIE